MFLCYLQKKKFLIILKIKIYIIFSAKNFFWVANF